MAATPRIPLRAERFKAFVDAVVAIAMTLLILPLMEAVSEARQEQLHDPDYDTVHFLTEHGGQVWALALSFVLIALFWMGHHQLYDEVERITKPLMWLNVAWMFTIVCLPVTTALVGAMQRDPAQVVLYIGNLMLTQVAGLAARMYLLRHRELTTANVAVSRRETAEDAAVILTFVIAMMLALFVPTIGYGSMFVVLLAAPLARVSMRIHERRNPTPVEGSE